jgi:hypothetical protein
MKKGLWIALGILGIAALGAAGYWWLEGLPAFRPAQQPFQVIDKRWGRGELKVSRLGNSLTITPVHRPRGRSPFYLDPPANGAGGLDFMYYQSETRTRFFRFLPERSQPEQLFEVAANVESGAVLAGGTALVYRESPQNVDPDGNLWYQAKGKPGRILLQHCNFYSVSPDRTRVIAGGALPDAKTQTRKLYLISAESGALTELAQARAPQNWDELTAFECHWSALSGHVAMDRQVFAIPSGQLLTELSVPNARISMAAWSPDGARLAFAIQSGRYQRYTAAMENHELYLSDQLGIYNPRDGAIQIIPLDGGLISQFQWERGGIRLIAATVPLATAEAYIQAAQSADSVDHYDLVLIDPVPATAHRLLADCPLVEIAGFEKDLLFFSMSTESGEVQLFGHDLRNRSTASLLPETTAVPYPDGDQIYLLAEHGLYRTGPELRAVKVLALQDGGDGWVLPERKTVVLPGSDRIRIQRFQ